MATTLLLWLNQDMCEIVRCATIFLPTKNHIKGIVEHNEVDKNVRILDNLYI